MASSKVMPSSTTSNSRNSDLSSHHHLHHHHRHLNHPSSDPMTSDFTPNSDTHRCNNADDLASPIHGIFYAQNSDDAEISLIDAAGAISALGAESSMRRKTADEVWREILAGKGGEFKAEAASDEMMTLEDFLAKAGEGGEEEDIKVTLSGPPILNQSGGFIGFDHHPLVQNQNSFPMGFGNGGGEMVVGGRGKRRGGPMMETLDKAAQQRQKRMIKNRESAARSRERKQAYQVELESLALKLEEENEQLLREKVERTNERYKQLMEKVVPVVEKRRPTRTLRRVRSMQW